MSYPNPGSPGGPIAQQPWAAPTQQTWAPDAPAVNAYWVNVVPGFVKGRQSEFRDSVLLQMNEGGITIEGEAVPMGGAYGLRLFVWGSLITEYAMRSKKAVPIPWADVEAIRLDPQKQKGVVCYHLPNKPKALFSMGFKMNDLGAFQHFAQMARAFAPAKMQEGKIKRVNTAQLVALVVILVGVIVFVAILSNQH